MPQERTDTEYLVDSLLEDLSKRTGIGDEWASTDPEIRQEIRQSWLSVVNLWMAVSRRGNQKCVSTP